MTIVISKQIDTQYLIGVSSVMEVAALEREMEELYRESHTKDVENVKKQDDCGMIQTLTCGKPHKKL